MAGKWVPQLSNDLYNLPRTHLMMTWANTVRPTGIRVQMNLQTTY